MTGIPEFCTRLPQREAAFQATRRLERHMGLPAADILESRVPGENVVKLIAVSPDGMRYGVGYEWTERQVAELT